MKCGRLLKLAGSERLGRRSQACHNYWAAELALFFVAVMRSPTGDVLAKVFWPAAVALTSVGVLPRPVTNRHRTAGVCRHHQAAANPSQQIPTSCFMVCGCYDFKELFGELDLIGGPHHHRMIPPSRAAPAAYCGAWRPASITLGCFSPRGRHNHLLRPAPTAQPRHTSV